MRKHLLAIFLFSCIFSAQAQQSIYQLSDGGEPLGKKFSQYSKSIVYEEMPSFDVQALVEQDELNKNNKNIPYRFGYVHFTDFTLENSGTWQTLSNGSKIWQLGVQSANALSINLTFSKVKLPEGAKLFIYNPDFSSVYGAFTAKYISEDGSLATELVKGENVIIELVVPANPNFQPEIKLFSVVHGYRDLNGYIAKSFGDAGSCMNNVNCPAFAVYEQQKRSVVCLVSGGEFCTGALINNTCNDGTPYVLTANHCGSSGFGSWVFRFNWEASGCSNPGGSPSTAQSISGGTQRAANAGSDMSLVQINSAVPTSYNPFFSGWDRQDISTSNAYGIHHPSGDIKKISFTTGSTSTATYSSATCWKTGTWTDGVTEPGSSGSPLFNQSGQIIGQLYGGPSACQYEGNAANGYDYYGKLFTSWTGGGTNSSRLSNWLAPSGCGTAPPTLNGYDPNAVSYALDARLSSIISPTNGTFCTSSFTPQVTIQNSGSNTLTTLSIKYRVDNGTEITYNWSGSLATNATANVSLANFNTTAGNHTFKVYTAAPNGGIDLNNANDTSIVSFEVLNPVGASLPLTEGFEGTTFPPNNWSLDNSDNAGTWQRTTTASSTGNASARKDNYNDDDAGQTDNLLTPYLSFASQTSVTLKFDVAYARYSAQYFDSLIVYATVDCGNTWTRVYNKGNSTLATVSSNATNGGFVPTAAQWRTETVDLSAFAGQSNVRILFQNQSGFGQMLYIDNVNISGYSNASIQEKESFDVSVFPNPSTGLVHIHTGTAGKLNVKVVDMTGKTVIQQFTSSEMQFTIDLTSFTKGIYLLSLENESGTVIRKLIKQ